MRSGSATDRRSLSPSSRRGGRVSRGVGRSKSSDGAPPRPPDETSPPKGSGGSSGRSTRTSGGGGGGGSGSSSRHRRASIAVTSGHADHSTRSTRSEGGHSTRSTRSTTTTTEGGHSTRSTRSDTATMLSSHRRTSTDSQRSTRSAGGHHQESSQRSTRSSTASFKQRSASGSPNNPRRRVSTISHASPRQDSRRRTGSSSNLMSLAGGADTTGADRSSRRSNRRSSLQVPLGGTVSSIRTRSTGNILADFSSNSVSSQESQHSSNFQWQKDSSASFSLTSPRGKQRTSASTRNIPPRVKSLGAGGLGTGTGSSSHRRASVAALLKNPPPPAPAAASAATTGTESGPGIQRTTSKDAPSLSPGTITNFHANLMRPSQFSTKSSKVARQFLEEDVEDKPLIGGDSKLPARGASTDSVGGEAAAASDDPYAQDMSEYSEAMSLHASVIMAGGASSTDLEWNPEAQRQQQEEWRNFQARGREAAEKSSKASRNFPQRKDLREVDQTVNLMDASLADYDRLQAPSTSTDHNRRGSYYSHHAGADSHGKSKKSRSGGANILGQGSSSTTSASTSFFSQASSSLAEFFLDEPSTDSGSGGKKKRRGRKKQRKKHRRSKHNYRSNNCCQDLFCSRMTLVLLVAGLLGAFIAWQTGAFVKTDYSENPQQPQQQQDEQQDKNDSATAVMDAAVVARSKPTTNINKKDDADNLVSADLNGMSDANLEGVQIVTSGPMDEFQTMLVDLDVSTRTSLATINSPQYLAWYWITNLEDATLLCVKPPQDDEELDKILLEAYALAVLYYGANGRETYNTTVLDHYRSTCWRDNTNWMRPTPICHWYGLDCEDDSHIVHLNMNRNNLKGTFPQELKVLTDLRTMDFGLCGIAGTLPEDVWPNLDQLEYLFLHQNSLTGTLPSSLGNLTSLQNLRLFGNRLEGQLPLHLNNMTNLRELSLQENLFDGSIPYLAHLVELETLQLQENKLTKHVPYEAFRFLKMKEFRLENNELTGTIPPVMQSMRELRIVALDNNKLSGTLHDMFDHFDYLEELHLSNNKFTGTIPKTFGHLTSLRHLTLDINKMTGTIPVELSLMTELKEMRLYRNQITGTLPSEVCDLKTSHGLEYLALDCARKVSGCKQGDSCCDRCM